MSPTLGETKLTAAAGLDASYIDQAAPPGSLRYFALLYTEASRRDVLAALFVIEKEIRDSANNASHDVAHTRLQWWRAEIDRLVNGAPQHPATRALHSRAATLGLDFSWLHELLVAADMDVASMTYTDGAELSAYCRRSGGVLLELAARALVASGTLTELAREAVGKIGSGIRRYELLRELPQEARRGRLYVPLDTLQAHQLTPADLQSSTPALQGLLSALAQTTRQQLQDGIETVPRAERSALRPVLVLAALNLRGLERFAKHIDTSRALLDARIELKPLERVWIAWRAARRAS